MSSPVQGCRTGWHRPCFPQATNTAGVHGARSGGDGVRRPGLEIGRGGVKRRHRCGVNERATSDRAPRGRRTPSLLSRRATGGAPGSPRRRRVVGFRRCRWWVRTGARTLVRMPRRMRTKVHAPCWDRPRSMLGADLVERAFDVNHRRAPHRSRPVHYRRAVPEGAQGGSL